MAKKEIFVGIGVDVDSVAGQIGSYAGGDSPSDISRGVFASEVGTPACSSCSTGWASRPAGSSPAIRSRPSPGR